jgi:hypothetical protein
MDPLIFPFSDSRRRLLLDAITTRHVYVETEKNYCSGVKFRSGEVLTVYHVQEPDSWIKVDGKPATVIGHDKASDLLLLAATPDDSITDPEICSEPEQLDAVISIGNWRRTKGFVALGNVMRVTRTRAYITNKIMDGFSGGGAYLLNGKLFGIIREVQGNLETGRMPNVVIGSEIRRFLRKTHPNEQQLGHEFMLIS